MRIACFSRSSLCIWFSEPSHFRSCVNRSANQRKECPAAPDKPRADFHRFRKETVDVKKVAALLAVTLASVVAVAACSSKSDSGASTTTTATDAPTAAAMSTTHTAIDPGTDVPKGTLPIPLSKLPSISVAAGSAANGAKLFAANCESCHGAGGKNGQVGPTLAG